MDYGNRLKMINKPENRVVNQLSLFFGFSALYPLTVNKNKKEKRVVLDLPTILRTC